MPHQVNGAQCDERSNSQRGFLRAIKQHGTQDLRRTLEDAIKGPDALDTEDFYAVLLHAIDRGDPNAVECLLLNGASPAQQRIIGRPLSSPLIRAVTSKQPNLEVVSLLLEYSDDSMIDSTNEQGRTALMLAALHDRLDFFNKILERGAQRNTVDKQQKNVLHVIASDSTLAKSSEVVTKLWDSSIDFLAKDALGRDPLHWACATGKVALVRQLIPKYERIALAVPNPRNKTYLHLAVAHNHAEVARILINRQCDIHVKSHGGWTVLHHACKNGNLEITRLLTTAGANINARLRNGSTPLHLAAQEAHVEVVLHLLDQKQIQPASKDDFGRTPFLLAAERKCKLVHMPSMQDMEERYAAILVALFGEAQKALPQDAKRACEESRATVMDFGDYPNGNRVQKFSVYDILYKIDAHAKRASTLAIFPGAHKLTKIRWLHLPANNIEWVEVLFDKAYMEGSSATIDTYRTLQASLNHYRQALLDHSPFVGPFCFENNSDDENDSLERSTSEHSRAFRPLHISMPYLHYETNSGRRLMQDLLKDIESNKSMPRIPTSNVDGIFLKAYRSTSPSPAHIRRTLDQFYLRGVETEQRDEDQVVFRHQKNRNISDPKIYMIDELWMWLVTDDLVVTCFPRRWNQSEDDDLDILGGLISQINSGIKGEIRTVQELARIITGRCIGTFDRHTTDPAYHFFQMFRSSIDAAIDREAHMFTEFQAASNEVDDIRSFRRNPNNGSNYRLSHDDRVKVDSLLTIEKETELVIELKDILDELFILRTVLSDQKRVLRTFEEMITSVSGKATRIRSFRWHSEILENDLGDISGMEEKAGRTLGGITSLLDMKEKHMNLVATESAQDQSLRSSTQGDAILIFTLVTVVFTPLSFVAAFFTISIREFPGADPDHGMPLGFVSKYLFSIGLTISILVIMLALLLDKLRGVYIRMMLGTNMWWQDWLNKRRTSKPVKVVKKVLDEESGDIEPIKSTDVEKPNGAISVQRAKTSLDAQRRISRRRHGSRT